MKKSIFIAILLFAASFSAYSQSPAVHKSVKVTKKSKLIGQVVIGGSSFDESAILTVTSSTKGALMPRMNTGQRDDIGSPATGLLIYNTTTNQYEFFETTWQAVGGGGNTIYSADDNLDGNRIVTMGANSLTFSGNKTTFKGIDATSLNFVFVATDNVDTKLLRVRNDGYIVGGESGGGATFGSRLGSIASFSFAGGFNNEVSDLGLFALGIDNIVTGKFAGALGSTNTSSGRATIPLGESHNLAGDHSFAAGNNVIGTAASDFSSGIGDNINLSASWTHAKGLDLIASNSGSQVIGVGFNSTTGRLENSIQFSLMVGFRTDVSTFFIGDANGLGKLGNIGLFNITAFGASGEGVLGIGNAAVVPGSSPSNMFQMYANDIVAGNSAPHFRTENGDIIKLFADGSYVDPTGTSDKSTFATSTVTTEDLAEFVKAMYEALKANGLLKN